jgi:hypothetical protein
MGNNNNNNNNRDRRGVITSGRIAYCARERHP